MITKRNFITCLFFVFCLLTFSPGWSICHASLTLEGQFIINGEKLSTEQQVKMTVRIYDDEFSGELLFAEKQNVTAGPKKSVFVFEQGKVTTHRRTSDLEPETLWVEVESDDQILNPRLKLSNLDTVNDLEGDGIILRNASLRSGGTATLLIDNNGVTLGNLLDLGSESINLGGVARNTWPTGGGSSTDADTLDGHDSSYFMTAATDNWVNTTGDTMSGSLTVNGTLKTNARLYVGTDDGTDNDYIHFDSGTAQFLMWYNSKDKFHLSNDLSLQGTLQAGTNSIDAPTKYNRFGLGTASHTGIGQITNSADLLISDDLEVNGDIYTGNNLWVGSNDSTDNDVIYFDSGTSESLKWNNSEEEFQLSDDLKVDGEYRYASDKTYYYQIPPCQFCRSSSSTNYVCDTLGGKVDYPGTFFTVYAPVHLPEGATITGVTFYYCDYSDSAYLEIKGYLYRRPLTYASLKQEIASYSGVTTESGNSEYIIPGVATITSNPYTTINNNTYQYSVRVRFVQHSNGYISFCGCRIAYTLNKVAP